MTQRSIDRITGLRKLRRACPLHYAPVPPKVHDSPAMTARRQPDVALLSLPADPDRFSVAISRLQQAARQGSEAGR